MFFDAVIPQLHDYIIHRLGNGKDADDILQETAQSIVHGLRKVEAKTDGALWGWMRRIAFCRVSDSLRSKYADRAEYVDPEFIETAVITGSESKELSAADRLDLELLMRLLREAKFPCDEILWNHLVAGVEIDEIAGMYEMSYDAARMRIKRCLRAAQHLAEGL